jgi:hypothetical protein
MNAAVVSFALLLQLLLLLPLCSHCSADKNAMLSS